MCIIIPYATHISSISAWLYAQPWLVDCLLKEAWQDPPACVTKLCPKLTSSETPRRSKAETASAQLKHPAADPGLLLRNLEFKLPYYGYIVNKMVSGLWQLNLSS